MILPVENGSGMLTCFSAMKQASATNVIVSLIDTTQVNHVLVQSKTFCAIWKETVVGGNVGEFGE